MEQWTQGQAPNQSPVNEEIKVSLENHCEKQEAAPQGQDLELGCVGGFQCARERP